MTALDTLHAAGITYRQIDTWSHNQWIRPIHNGGTGRPREWPAQEIRIALLMKRLTDVGFSTKHAARIARQAEDARTAWGLDRITVNLGNGIHLIINPDIRTVAA